MFVLWISISTAVVASAQFDGMLSRVPADANTLIMINAEKMFGSPLADRERWTAKRKAAFDAGVSALPPDASTVLMAARTDFETGRNLWELSLMRFDGPRNVASVAKRFGGSIERIQDRDATRLPTNNYVVQISPNLLGSHTPASRQDVTRWLLSTDKTSLTQTMSPYLLTAQSYATKVGTPIVMAIDVSGVFSSDEAAARLETFESLKDNKELAVSIGKLASGVQGATLGITIGDSAIGAIRVDFSESPQPLATVLKPVLIEAIQRHGAMIDDFENWQSSVEGNSFMLRGPLSTTGARRVLSVLELPAALAQVLEETGGSASSGSDGSKPSQLYYQSITNLLSDIREKPKKDHVQTTGQAALWYGKYATKIDNLPILGVDSTLLNYGSDIAGGLRDAQSALRGVGMRTSIRTLSVNNSSSGPAVALGGYSTGGYGGGDSYNGGWGGYSYSYFDLRSGARAQDKANAAVQMEERVSGVAAVQSIWKNIDEATAMIRREMTQKYEVEF